MSDLWPVSNKVDSAPPVNKAAKRMPALENMKSNPGADPEKTNSNIADFA
jgi:hypothetical protein